MSARCNYCARWTAGDGGVCPECGASTSLIPDKKAPEVASPGPMTDSGMHLGTPNILPATWEEFRTSGLLWWVNRMLHLFGWCIVIVVEKDGVTPTGKVFPARCSWRGFEADAEERGFSRLTAHLKAEMPRLEREVGVHVENTEK